MFFNPFKELAEFGEWVCRLATCALCTGPIMIIIGIALLSSSATDGRGASVSKYNDISTSWVNSKRSLFLNKTYAISSTGGSLVLLADTSSDTYTDSGDLKLPNATIRYTKVSTTNMPFSSTTYSSPSTTISSFKFLSNGVVIQDLSSTIPVAGESTRSISCSSSDSFQTCANKCSGGVYTQNPSQCRTFYVISDICLVVDPTTDQLDTSGGSGCATTDSSLPVALRPDYKNNLVRAKYTTYTTSSVPLSVTYNPRVTVRSKDDPYVAYLRLTDGSGSFGLTTAQKVASGMAILGIGIAITVVVCGAIAYMIKCMRKPNQQGTIVSTSPPPPPQGGIMMIPQQQMVYANPQQQQVYLQQPMQMGYGKDQPVLVSGGYAVTQPQQQAFYPPPQQQMMIPQQQMAPQYYAQPQPGQYPPQQQSYPPQQGYPQQPQQGYPQQQYYAPQQGYPPQQ
jgi:hypothetical protein